MDTRQSGMLTFVSTLAFTLFGCGGPLLGEPSQSEPQQPADLSRSAPTPEDPYFGLSSFPYDFTPAAVNKVFELGRDHGEIYVVQRDNGIPWAEALENKPFPQKMMGEWEDFKRRRPAGRPFYLAIAPLDFDRKNLADAVEGSTMPRDIRGAAFDSEAVKNAYANYCRRAVEFFEPDYLNIGVEAGELAHRRPSAWPAFSRLIQHVRNDLKQHHPNVQVGISFGLQSLMEQEAAERSKPLIEECDFLGLSFYPYMSGFHEKFGTEALQPPPNEWRAPLDWVRAYTSKPIAICETGYNTQDVSMPKYGISLKGSRELQKQFVEELAGIARRDDYLFVVYYFSVDLDRLFEKLPEGGGEAALWESNGFLNKDLEPKPAWDTWKKVVRDEAGLEAPTAAPESESSSGGETSGAVNIALPFKTDKDLFSAPGDDKVRMPRAEKTPSGSNSQRWTFDYRKNEWKWASRKLNGISLAGASSLSFVVKSDRDSPIIVQLSESSGEKFWAAVTVTKDWQTVDLNFSQFQVDQGSKKDGVLDPAAINEIILADGGGTEGRSGRRSIWSGDWLFR